MLYLIVAPSQLIVPSETDPASNQPSSPTKFWQLLIDWLLEPIAFPGKYDIYLPPPHSYNQEKKPTSPPPSELDGR
jgi:hypothetical protein